MHVGRSACVLELTLCTCREFVNSGALASFQTANPSVSVDVRARNGYGNHPSVSAAYCELAALSRTFQCTQAARTFFAVNGRKVNVPLRSQSGDI